MKYIKLLFWDNTPFPILYNEIKKYDYFSHMGLFLLYNSPIIIGIISLFIIKTLFGGIGKFLSTLPKFIQLYFYDGACIIGDTPTWRLHLGINFLIFLFVIFKLEE